MNSVVPLVGDRSVVVFDWDDTFLPTTELASRGCMPNSRTRSSTDVIPDSSLIQRELAQLAKTIEQLIEQARSIGPVFIVTAASHGWVELSCQIFFPSLFESALAHDDVHIISARSWYMDKYGEETLAMSTSADWKEAVLAIIAQECFTSEEAAKCNPMDGSFNFISIGDSLAERHACHCAAQLIPFCVAKSIKFIDHPTIAQLQKQLEMTLCCFWHLSVTETSLDIHFNHKELNKMMEA